MLSGVLVSRVESCSVGNVLSLTVRGSEGEIGILPRHIPLVTALVAGSNVVFRTDSGTRVFEVGDRTFFHFSGETAEVITDRFSERHEPVREA